MSASDRIVTHSAVPARAARGDNAQLTSVVAPFGQRDIQQVAIWGNPNLRQLDLLGIEHVDGLLIADNPRLETATAASLERAGDLVIIDNPALSVASFSNVQTFNRDVSGNLDALAP